MLKLDDTVKEILGRPNFQCANIAIALRTKGFKIEARSEDEQANVLYWMLTMYEKHGENWKDEATKFINE